jgi:uncharacterized delta-60 repeat protein
LFLKRLKFSYPELGLDTSFGNNGVVYLDYISRNFSNISDLKVQHDGKVLLAGSYYNYYEGVPSSFMIIRYNVNGSLDTSFGESGKSITNIYPRDNMHQQSYLTKLGLQNDGKVIASGTTIPTNSVASSGNDFAIVRYLP